MIKATLHTSNVRNREASDYLPVPCDIGPYCTRPERHMPRKGTNNAEVQ